MSVLDYRSAKKEAEEAPRGWRNHWLLWAIYLAMSWTWCIGMFLPVLLVRDFGVWGWVAFAIPNVLGAAAVGWIYRSGEQSRQTLQSHAMAVTAFSVVTATFQIFFAMWAFHQLAPNPQLFVITTVVLAFAIALLSQRRPVLALHIALIVFGVSMTCFVWLWTTGSLWRPTVLLQLIQYPPRRNLQFLVPGMFFGF